MEPFIESGIERLAFDNIRYTKKQLQKLNEETLERSTHPSRTPRRLEISPADSGEYGDC